MALEKRYALVPPQSFTADGTNTGVVTIADTTLFKVKQKVLVESATSVDPLQLEVKRVNSRTEMILGPRGGRIDCYTDLSGFTTALSSTVRAVEQKRQDVPVQEIERFVYCEEPVVANRVCLVDEIGDMYSDKNPIPIEISGITIESVSVQLTHLDNFPTIGDVHDSVRIGDGVNLAEVTGKKEIRVVDTLHCGGTSTIINVTDTPIAVQVSGSPKSDRKTVFVQPRAKGIVWGFNSDVDTTNGVKGGAPLGKNQPLEITAESNTTFYIVGPASGVDVFIAEA